MDGGKEWLEKGAKKLGDGKVIKTQVRTFSQSYMVELVHVRLAREHGIIMGDEEW